MRVETLGSGTPAIAVVGGVHGDEPCGQVAIDRFLERDPDLDRPVRFVVANEEALSRGSRYVERDLNRVLPGDPESDIHEERLAVELLEAVEGCTPLGIHSTRSYAEPFGVLADPTPAKRRLFRRMNVSAVLDTTGLSSGRCVDHGFLDVEAGLQGTDQAADNAVLCIESFLAATGALESDVSIAETGTETILYEVTDIIEKEPESEYRFLAENFEWVEAGTVYAERDDEPMTADEAFVPALSSSDGHASILGYRTRPAGVL
ncbi:M14 family metallopeptidase [Salinigranum rubrum]|uniref:succinylglutamate desuccinylase/aspartoacylase domain-containing protein n=1 Tax=Salinigranum rubrum TaxID=755307 RepID=UPI0013A53FE2|nr:succinylglutamate desuccinylase/aspartoacylase family protein [Salinigranum rubrum]